MERPVKEFLEFASLVRTGIYPGPPEWLDSWEIGGGWGSKSLLDYCPAYGSVWEWPWQRSKTMREICWMGGMGNVCCTLILPGTSRRAVTHVRSVFAAIPWSQYYYYLHLQKRKRSTEKSKPCWCSIARESWNLNPDTETVWSWRLCSQLPWPGIGYSEETFALGSLTQQWHSFLLPGL